MGVYFFRLCYNKSNMAAITPSTELYLLKAPLEDDGRNTLTFASKTAQYNYFIGLPKLNDHGLSSVDANPDFTYQRKDGIIRFPAHIDDLYGYNYVMYKNANYGNKWFYAFISKMEYVNDNTTFISIKTDPFQTWQFDMNYKPSFVEREHANTDVAGDNTIPENFELGEPIANGQIASMNFGFGAQNTYFFCFQVVDLPSNKRVQSHPSIKDWVLADLEPRNYNGIFSGTYFFCVLTPTMAQWVIDAYNYAGLADAIVSIFYAPITVGLGPTTSVSVERSGDDADTKTVLITSPTASNDAKSYDDLVLSRPSSVDGYVPKNNKLYTWPYCWIVGSNNSGQEAEYKYEDFAAGDIHFAIRAALCQGMSSKMYPYNYKDYTGFTALSNYSITGAKLPTISWKSDHYLNWEAQNSGVVATGVFTGAGSSMIGAAISGPNATGLVGAGISMIGSVMNTMAEIDRQKRLPDQAKGNVAAGDINWSMKTTGFSIRPMSIRYQFARIVDNFFSMYGYKTNRVKVPNITGRANWNYVKTIGLNFTGDMPQEDADEIRTLFDNGLTLWHNPSTYLDYSQNNPIV